MQNTFPIAMFSALFPQPRCRPIMLCTTLPLQHLPDHDKHVRSFQVHSSWPRSSILLTVLATLVPHANTFLETQVHFFP